MNNSAKRVFLIVLDSFGIGDLPDASEYGDVGSNTFKSCFDSGKLRVPVMASFGLFNIDGIDFGQKALSPKAAFGRCAEASAGKDTTVGHFEICGLISEKKFPTYPNGFPDKILDEFREATGRGVLCNKPYSGTQVILDYGRQHVETGDLIVYTSADSVFQIAAHEDIVGLNVLYDYCRAARNILQGEHGVARVIARPFKGEYPSFYRTANRHDFSLSPPGTTLLDELSSNGIDILPVGKIYDIFAGKSLREAIPTKGNDDGMKKTSELQQTDFSGLCFVNLVDFDMVYGHRNDVSGYTEALNRFDLWLGDFIDSMQTDDVLIITADHGCDPSTPSTDHSREYTPLLVYGSSITPVNLGTRSSYADIGKTVGDILGIDAHISGESFKSTL